jgi:hypothetical protein
VISGEAEKLHTVVVPEIVAAGGRVLEPFGLPTWFFVSARGFASKLDDRIRAETITVKICFISQFF